METESGFNVGVIKGLSHLLACWDSFWRPTEPLSHYGDDGFADASLGVARCRLAGNSLTCDFDPMFGVLARAPRFLDFAFSDLRTTNWAVSQRVDERAEVMMVFVDGNSQPVAESRHV